MTRNLMENEVLQKHLSSLTATIIRAWPHYHLLLAQCDHLASIRIPTGGSEASESVSQMQEAGQRGFEYIFEPVSVFCSDPQLTSALATVHRQRCHTIERDEWPTETRERERDGEIWREIKKNKKINLDKREQTREKRNIERN